MKVFKPFNQWRYKAHFFIGFQEFGNDKLVEKTFIVLKQIGRNIEKSNLLLHCNLLHQQIEEKK